MDIAVVVGIVVAGIIVGVLLKKIISFLILSVAVAAGVWFFVLDDNQKHDIENTVNESKTIQDIKKKAQEYSGEAKEKAQELIDEAKN